MVHVIEKKFAKKNYDALPQFCRDTMRPRFNGWVLYFMVDIYMRFNLAECA